MNVSLPQGILAGTHQPSNSLPRDEDANNNSESGGISPSHDDAAGALFGLNPDDSHQHNSTTDSLSPRLNQGDDQNPTPIQPRDDDQDQHPIQPPAIPPIDSMDTDFEDLLLCPINQQPPVKGVRFTIPDNNGFVSPQVFEYSALVKYVLRCNRTNEHSVKHPMTSAVIPRKEAVKYFTEVTPEEQQKIHDQRIKEGLSLFETDPVSLEDIIMLTRMHER